MAPQIVGVGSQRRSWRFRLLFPPRCSNLTPPNAGTVGTWSTSTASRWTINELANKPALDGNDINRLAGILTALRTELAEVRAALASLTAK